MTVKYNVLNEQLAVEILEGELEGLTYQYDGVELEGVGDELSLTYSILDVTGEKIDGEVLELDLFSETNTKILGDILVDIIETHSIISTRLKEMNKEVDNGDS